MIINKGREEDRKKISCNNKKLKVKNKVISFIIIMKKMNKKFWERVKTFPLPLPLDTSTCISTLSTVYNETFKV